MYCSVIPWLPWSLTILHVFKYSKLVWYFRVRLEEIEGNFILVWATKGYELRPVRLQIGLHTNACFCLHEAGLKNHLMPI